jgi:hypothetical protein
MSKKGELLKEQLIQNADMIATEIEKGNDVEIRCAPNGGIKVMTVRKQTICEHGRTRLQ